MKTLLLAAAALLAAAPAVAQTPAPPADRGTPANFLDLRDSPFNVTDPTKNFGQCFDGRTVVGATRTGDHLYVQGRGGAVFRLRLAEGCDGMNQADLTAAEKLTVRSEGTLVCGGVPATVKIQTPTGSKSCSVRMVRRMSGTELAAKR